MKAQPKLIDTFQIIGFVISTAVSIILILVQIDATLSVILGLLLAVLTQLFDLQLRHAASEERLLKANSLSQSLYRDELLLRYIQQIVSDYYLVKNGWFGLFMLRGKAAIEECHAVLHRMAEGEMEVPRKSAFTFSYEGIKSAEKSLKALTIDNLSYWNSHESDKFLKTNAELIQRGVSITRVFVIPKDKIRENINMLQRHTQIGIEVYVVFAEELFKEQSEGFNIMDDRVVTHFQRLGDGRVRERSISINPVEVEKMIKRFDIVMRYARKIDEILAKQNSPMQKAG